MQSFGSQDVALDQRMKRLQGRRAGADLVGQRRHAQIDAFAPVAFALAVQRLMLAELLKQDHGQQVWSGEIILRVRRISHPPRASCANNHPSKDLSTRHNMRRMIVWAVLVAVATITAAWSMSVSRVDTGMSVSSVDTGTGGGGGAGFPVKLTPLW